MFQPFVVPKYVNLDGGHRVAPYERIFDDLEIGLSSAQADVRVAQSIKNSFLISPPDHHYLLDVSVGDIADTKWITLEFMLDPSKVFDAGRVTVLVSLAASTEQVFGVDLRLVRGDDSFEDMHLGQIKPSREEKFVSQNLSQPLDGFLDRLDEMPKTAKILIFAPVEANFKLSLAMLNVHYSDE